MSLEKTLEKLRAAMRNSSAPKADCPPNSECYSEVDGKCFKYNTYWKRTSTGECVEDRSTVKVSGSPCNQYQIPRCD